MTDQSPLARDIQTRPADTLELRPDDSGIDAALGLGVNRTNDEVFPLVHLVFHDALAGDIQVTLDTRTGYPEHLHSQLSRLLAAVQDPDSDDGHALTAMLANLAQQIGDQP